jgi:hypothetical protein
LGLFVCIAVPTITQLWDTPDIFPALKPYFLSLEKCPVSHQNISENTRSSTRLHFLASQLKTFTHTIK